MSADKHQAHEAHDEFIIDCGGIQPEPLLPSPEEECPFTDPFLAGNEQIEELIHRFHQEQTPELFTAICLTIREQMTNDKHFVFPADITEDEDGNTLFSFKTLDLEIGPAMVAFTSLEEKEKAPHSGAVSQFIDSVLEPLMQMDEIQGIILNPWGESLFLGKEDIGVILTPGSERFI